MQASLLGFCHESLVIDNDIIGAVAAHDPRHRGERRASLSFETIAPGLHRGPGPLSRQPADPGADAARLLLPVGRRPHEPEGMGRAGPDRHRRARHAQGRARSLARHFPAHLAGRGRLDPRAASRSACRRAPMRPAASARALRHEPARPASSSSVGGRRLQRALPSGAARLDRLPAAGDERADLRLDLACRRQLPDLLGQLERDEDAAPIGASSTPPLGRAGRRRINYHVHGFAPPRASPRAHGRVPPRRSPWRRRRGSTSSCCTPAQARELYPFLELHDLRARSGIRWTATSTRAS